MIILISKLKSQRDNIVKQLNKSKKAKFVFIINNFFEFSERWEWFEHVRKTENKWLFQKYLSDIKNEFYFNRSCLNKSTIKMGENFIEELENYVILMELSN
ncbi:MAG: hypothetical protein K0R18_1292 [Bacillales bacterium]|jgi:hypothetical protein|nr:hypothetical protein [Bacillales bacterium]